MTRELGSGPFRYGILAYLYYKSLTPEGQRQMRAIVWRRRRII
jgi:hypothetical protein